MIVHFPIFCSTSFLGTATSRRSKSLNRAYSSDGFGGGRPCFLPMIVSLRRAQRERLAREPLVRQAPTRDRAEHRHEAVAVVPAPPVVAERLLVHVPETDGTAFTEPSILLPSGASPLETSAAVEWSTGIARTSRNRQSGHATARRTRSRIVGS